MCHMQIYYKYISRCEIEENLFMADTLTRNFLSSFPIGSGHGKSD